jgi:hypothetical protein
MLLRTQQDPQCKALLEESDLLAGREHMLYYRLLLLEIDLLENVSGIPCCSMNCWNWP